jgi:hypothetical protein
MDVGGPSVAVDAGDAGAAIAKGEVEADGVLGPSAAANAGDAETSVAKGEVEADGIPGNMASFPPGPVRREGVRDGDVRPVPVPSR